MISSYATHIKLAHDDAVSLHPVSQNNSYNIALNSNNNSNNNSIANLERGKAASSLHATIGRKHESSIFAKIGKWFNLTDAATVNSEYIHIRKIGILQLVGIAFFTTAGGPYGLEVCVQTGGILVTIIGLLIMPIIYATPQALMTAELSNMMPENGGYVKWVFRAFGDFMGYINAYNAIICNLFDNAIYPTLIMEYYHTLYPTHIHGATMFFLKEFIVLLGFIVNVQSIRKIGDLGIWSTLLILIPFTLGFFMALPSIDWNEMNWGPINNDGTHDDLTFNNVFNNMPLFLSTLFWCHTGWDGLGNFAGEVINPQKTYPVGVTIAILVNLLNFLTSVIAGMAPKYTKEDIKEHNIWEEGYFAIAYREIWWPLGLGVAVSNTVCQTIIYFNTIASTSRIIAVMGDNVLASEMDLSECSDKEDYCDNHVIENNGNYMERMENDSTFENGIGSLQDDSKGYGHHHHIHSQNNNNNNNNNNNYNQLAENNERRLRLLPKIFGKIDNRTHSPIVAIAFQTGIIACLMGYGFDTLVEVSVTLNCVTLVIEFAAFLYLRYKEPNAPRPYIIPGGLPVAWLITVVKITLVVTVILLTTSQLGLVFWITVGVNVMIIIVFIVRKMCFPEQEQENEY